jgi:hypothetical protein
MSNMLIFFTHALNHNPHLGHYTITQMKLLGMYRRGKMLLEREKYKFKKKCKKNKEKQKKKKKKKALVV